MSDLVAKTRVSWAIVVVNLTGVKSLHLIKKSYRGNITYYSKSARGVVDKIGFGEIVTCQSGMRKENDARVDYLEFRNSLQQVANWKLAEFEPTLEGGEFGRKLQILRSNPPQLCIYLNHLIRCSSWNLHNPDVHTKLGEAKEENIYPLSENEKEAVVNLMDTTESESMAVKSMKAAKTQPKVKLVGRSTTKEQNDHKKKEIVNSMSGLEANFLKGILGFEQVDADKITTHKGIINEKLDKHKIDSLKLDLVQQFDPKLSVITVAPSVRTAAEYVANKEVTFKVLEGRHVFTAMKELYSEGKTFKGLEIGKVMVVILNNPGVIAANYCNMRQKHLSDQYSSQINIQDFIKLLVRICDVIKDKNQALEIVKNSMITFNYNKDDVTAITRFSKWSAPGLIKLIEVLDFYENFQSLDSEKKKKSLAQLIKSGKKLPVPKLTFHRIAKCEENKFLPMAQQVLTREITLTELATWSMNLYKLEGIKQQCLEIVQETGGDDEIYEVFEDLSRKFPDEFSDESLVGFSKSVKGDTFKTGDRIRLENFILQTVTCDSARSDISQTIQFVEMEGLSSSFFCDASCVILNTKVLHDNCLEYYVKKVSSTNTGLVVICKSQDAFHKTIELIKALEDKEDASFKLFTLVVKDPKITVNVEGTDISSDLVFVVICGSFELSKPPLKVFFGDLTSCLRESVNQLTTQGGKVYSVNYMGSSICVIPPKPGVCYTYYGSGNALKQARQLTAEEKFDSPGDSVMSQL